MCGVDGRVPRNGTLRTASGPGGSSAKQALPCAAGVPDRSLPPARTLGGRVSTAGARPASLPPTGAVDSAPMKRSLYREYRPQTFEELVGQQHVARTLRNAVRDGQRRPRVRVRRSARHRQDERRAHPGQGAQLPRHRGAAGQGPHVDPVRRLSQLPDDRHRHLTRRHRDGRGLQPQHRRHPRAPRPRRFRPCRGALQGLHRRRGPHAHEGGLQRPPEDARGAPGERRLRAGHDRAAQDPGDHHLALPALRLPPSPPRPRSRACCAASSRTRTHAPTTSAAARPSTSRTPPCSRSPGTRRAASATPSARSRS